MSEVGQTNAAAERSAHAPAAEPGRCCICGGPWQKGASHAARVMPGGLGEVCSAACAADPRFAGTATHTVTFYWFGSTSRQPQQQTLRLTIEDPDASWATGTALMVVGRIVPLPTPEG